MTGKGAGALGIAVLIVAALIALLKSRKPEDTIFRAEVDVEYPGGGTDTHRIVFNGAGMEKADDGAPATYEDLVTVQRLVMARYPGASSYYFLWEAGDGNG